MASQMIKSLFKLPKFQPTQFPAHRFFSSKKDPSKVTIYFENWNGSDRETCHATEGDTILDVALQNNIDIEGACDGTLACSTCHVIVKDDDKYALLPTPEDEEFDMLDLALDLQPTSRLGCQIVVSKKLDGMTLIVPQSTRDAR
eukprot:Sdes_comp15507_c0_seq1m4442